MTTTPHAAAYEEVAALIQDYFDGLYYSDTQRLRHAFHPEAVYATASEDEPLILRMNEYFEVVDNRPSPASRGEHRTDHILSIEFAGPVTAVVKLQCSIYPKHFIDLLTLIRVDGRWQIIAKVFHFTVHAPL
jgi:hypothetical protein